jgi:hypothetical protein
LARGSALRLPGQVGDRDEATLSCGQDADPIHDIVPAGGVVRRIVAESEAILKDRLPGLVR